MIILGVTAFLVVFTSLGIIGAARRAAFARPLLIGIQFAVGVGLWLGLTAGLALGGVLEFSEGRLPREPILPLTMIIIYTLLNLTGTFRRLIAVLPTWQPVAIQFFRTGVELAFWRMYQEGIAPVQMSFEGRNFDLLVGLTAPILAAGIALRWLGPRVVIAWNFFALAGVGNAIFTSATSIPGPLRLNWPGEPFTGIAEWPVVWIPAFLAPTAIFLSVVSIRQAIAGLSGKRQSTPVLITQSQEA